MINRFSKIMHFVPLYFGKGRAFIEFVIKLLFNHIFKLHNLPKKIISDCNYCFTSDIAH